MNPITTRSITANGLTFAVDEAGQGDEVALLLHGFPEARTCWRAQLPVLAQMGWRAVAPDLRGYGQSSRPQGKAAYGIEHLVEDVDALFDALGAKRRLLIGHDWGGVIAWQQAIRGRVPLDGLVILNAPHPTIFQRELRGWAQKRRSWYVGFFMLPWVPERQMTAGQGAGLAKALKAQSPYFPEDLLDLYRANICAPGAATAMINYYRANAFHLSGPGAGAAPIKTPTLMIWGEGDQALGLPLTQGNEAFVEDFTLKRLPGVSHWVIEEAPTAINAAIADWTKTKGLNPK